jgi:hypothetical protein
MQMAAVMAARFRAKQPSGASNRLTKPVQLIRGDTGVR